MVFAVYLFIILIYLFIMDFYILLSSANSSERSACSRIWCFILQSVENICDCLLKTLVEPLPRDL